MRGGTTFSIGQLLEAAEQDARGQRAQGQVKTAQAAPAESIDLLSTPSVMALAQAGRKLASRMKLAEDDMEGPSGVNTGSASVKDSLTPSAETPRQFIVAPTGKVDVSPSDNRFSIPNQTEQKAPEPSMNPGASKPEEFLSPKIGQAQKKAQGTMDFSGGGPVMGSPVNLPPRAPISPEARSVGTTEGREAVERAAKEKKEGQAGKTSSLDPIRAVHERYSRAAAVLAKQAQPGGIAQPTTATEPLAGDKKPESTQPSSDTSGGTKPPTSFEAVRGTSRQDADAKALADAAAKTDLPAAAAKETTEGVLDEVLKAASADQVKAAAFKQWYATLPPTSKVASLIRNRLIQKMGQDLQSGTTEPPMVIQGRLPGSMNFEGGGVDLPPRFVPQGPPLRESVEKGQEAVQGAIPGGAPTLPPPLVVPAPAPPAPNPLPGMTPQMNQAWNPLSPQGQGL